MGRREGYMTPDEHVLYLYIVFECIIPIPTFYREAASGEVDGQRHYSHILLTAYFKEPATAFLQQKALPHVIFCIFLKPFYPGGNP